MAAYNIFDLSGKVAAVVGGGSGIGEAVALGAAEAGAAVVCLDVNMDAAAGVAAKAREGRALRVGHPRHSRCRRGRSRVPDDQGRARQPRHRDLHAEHQRAQEDPQLSGRRADARARSEPEGHVQRAPIGRPHHDRAAQGQHRALLVDPVAGRRARSVGLRRDEGRHRATGARRGVRVRPLRRVNARSRRRRNAAHHADQERSDWFTPTPPRVQSVGRPEEMVGPMLFLASDAASYDRTILRGWRWLAQRQARAAYL